MWFLQYLPCKKGIREQFGLLFARGGVRNTCFWQLRGGTKWVLNSVLVAICMGRGPKYLRVHELSLPFHDISLFCIIFHQIFITFSWYFMLFNNIFYHFYIPFLFHCIHYISWSFIVLHHISIASSLHWHVISLYIIVFHTMFIAFSYISGLSKDVHDIFVSFPMYFVICSWHFHYLFIVFECIS